MAGGDDGNDGERAGEEECEDDICVEDGGEGEEETITDGENEAEEGVEECQLRTAGVKETEIVKSEAEEDVVGAEKNEKAGNEQGEEHLNRQVKKVVEEIGLNEDGELRGKEQSSFVRRVRERGDIKKKTKGLDFRTPKSFPATKRVKNKDKMDVVILEIDDAKEDEKSPEHDDFLDKYR